MGSAQYSVKEEDKIPIITQDINETNKKKSSVSINLNTIKAKDVNGNDVIQDQRQAKKMPTLISKIARSKIFWTFVIIALLVILCVVAVNKGSNGKKKFVPHTKEESNGDLSLTEGTTEVQPPSKVKQARNLNVECRKLKAMNLLESNNSDFDSFGQSELQWAVSMGDIECVKWMFESNQSPYRNPSSMIRHQDHEGRTPVFDAALQGHSEILEYLITKCNENSHSDGSKCNVLNQKTNDYHTFPNLNPLEATCLEGHLSTLKVLLAHGAKLEITHYDSLKNPAEKDQDILDQYIHEYQHVHERQNCMYLAALNGHISIVRYIIEDVLSETSFNDMVWIFQKSAIYGAFEGGFSQIVEYLWKPMQDHVTQWIHESHDYAVTGYIKDHVEWLKTDTLLLSCALNHPSLVNFLFEHGIDANVTGGGGIDCAYLAALDNNIEILKLIATENSEWALKPYFIPEGAYREEPTSILRIAIGNQNQEIISLALNEGGANVNENLGEVYQKSPLIFASIFSNIDIAKLLVSNGADISIQSGGKTAEDWAKTFNNHEVADYLRNVRSSKSYTKRISRKTITPHEIYT